MFLKFLDDDGGFLLYNSNEDKHDDYLSGLVADNCDRNNQFNIIHLDYAFRINPIQEIMSIINDVDKNKNNIKGLYTVSELNIKNKPFIDVMKAVEKYYKNKILSQMQKIA